MMNKSYKVITEEETLSFAKALAKAIKPPCFITLSGTLGAGKTTLSRGVIQALGHQGTVKSPTYTIVETYELPDITIFHFDLYRIHDVEELELMGIRDYFAQEALILLEWPERGQGILPMADIDCAIEIQGNARVIKLKTLTEKGRLVVQGIS